MSQVSKAKCLLALLIAFAFFIPLAHAQVVDCPRSGIPVTMDGKWDGREWDDAVEVSLVRWSGYSSGTAFLRAKYDRTYFFTIIDVTSATTATGDDGASITFDTNNDGGVKPRVDDYTFNIFYGGPPSMAQGNGKAFVYAASVPKGVLANASIGSSPHSSKSHPMYEFRIPLSLFPKISTIRFAASTWYGWNVNLQDFDVLLAWPKDFFNDAPGSWGTMNFPTAIPEFADAMVAIVLTFCAAALVTRTRSRKRILS